MGELGIWAQLVDGSKLYVTCETDAIVQDLMVAVAKAAEMGCTPRLRFQGEILDAEVPVADTGMTSEAVVEVVGGIIFSHEHPFDENGLLYYIGTLGKTKTFKNPAHAKMVKCQKSPEWGDSASKIVGRINHYNRTDSRPDPYYEVDLQLATIAPTHYSLCHGRDSAGYVMRSWVLRGSNDGENWVDLDSRTDDDTLSKGKQGGSPPFYHATFDIADGKGVETPFRIFRLVSSCNWPEGSSADQGDRHYLHLCKFEIYGLAQFQAGWESEARESDDPDDEE